MDGDSAAAMRYTEARLSPMAMEPVTAEITVQLALTVLEIKAAPGAVTMVKAEVVEKRLSPRTTLTKS